MLLTGKTQSDLDRDAAVAKIATLKRELADTDWKVARSVETGQPIDAATTATRTAARAEITKLREEYNI